MPSAALADIRITETGAPGLSAALGWLRALLTWHVDVTRAAYGALADDPYRGLAIDEAEADLLCADWPAVPPALARRRRALAEERVRIEVAPLDRLARLFGLSPFARDVLLLALAPELDRRYETLFAYTQDDVTRRRPSVALALRLLCADEGAAAAERAAFLPGAPLLRERLVALCDEGLRRPPIAAHGIRLDDRVAWELLGHPALDPHLPGATLPPPGGPLEALTLPPGLADRLRRAAGVAGASDRHSATADPRLVLALQGGYGSGRGAIAAALAAAAGQPLLALDLAALPGDQPETEAWLRRGLREATLRGAAILWHGGDPLLHDEGRSAVRAAFLAALGEHPGRSFVALERPWEPRGELGRTRFVRVELPPLSYAERERVWRERLGPDAPGDGTLGALASTFRLSAGQIRDAAAHARREPDVTPDQRALFAAARAQATGRLDGLAQKVPATYGWGDLVLPADRIAMLREICLQVRHRGLVLERWGFGGRLAAGKGVSALFAGPSGTGKTMAAEVIAADLGLELYRVDLAALVSKYIGETEKNLDRVFDAARESNAVLLFDEADAIFGKRSEVKDAHDRYANIEVGYLLQKMESYDGIVVLATNLRKNLDDAFVRRLHAAVDFPLPEEPERLRIWRGVFPPAAPLTPDVDLAFLARQLKVTGGNIRNIALLAAYLAAESGGPVAMAHLVRAARREYQKIGKLVTAADFGPYLAIVEEAP